MAIEMALYKQKADLEIRRLNRLCAVLSRVNRETQIAQRKCAQAD